MIIFKYLKVWILTRALLRYGKPFIDIDNEVLILSESDGNKFYRYKSGYYNYHRLGGPAIEYYSGGKDYFIKGEHLSEEEHTAYVKINLKQDQKQTIALTQI